MVEKRHRLAEDVDTHALREDVRLEDAVDEERRVDRRDAGDARGTREQVHGVTKRGRRLFHREGERNRPHDLLDHGDVAERAPQTLLRCIGRRRLSETERDPLHAVLRVSVHVPALGCDAPIASSTCHLLFSSMGPFLGLPPRS